MRGGDGLPNRIIKDSIRTSKSINSLTDFQFRLWVYLITYVDDYGRGSAEPDLIKGFVFPRRNRVTESDIKKTLAELAGMGCINLYNVDGESYFYFPNWGEHQRIQTKRSKFPEPTSETHFPRNPTVNHGEPRPESESESESESEKSIGAAAPADPRKKHGQFGWVRLTDAEYQRLIDEFGADVAGFYINYVDESAEQTGNKNKWKNWNLTVRKAIKGKWGGGPSGDSPQSTGNPFLDKLKREGAL